MSARRSLVGAASYPFVLLAIGLTADLNRRAPVPFAVAAAAILALTALRVHLAWRFDTLFPPAPGAGGPFSIPR